MESNKEGKEALTAEQILENHYPGIVYEDHFATCEIVRAMQKYALLKVAEKEKEIERLNLFINDTLLERIRSLEKQVSEVAESRKANETFNKCKEIFESDQAGYKAIDKENPHSYAFIAGFYHKMLKTLFDSGEIVPPERLANRLEVEIEADKWNKLNP
jgi:hypothetical protein